VDTSVGTLEVAIPKLRSGSHFPDWLLQRRKRGQRAMVSVGSHQLPAGASTRRMERLVEQLGITRLSKSQVSVMAPKRLRTRRARRVLPHPATRREGPKRSWPRTR